MTKASVYLCLAVCAALLVPAYTQTDPLTPAAAPAPGTTAAAPVPATAPVPDGTLIGLIPVASPADAPAGSPGASAPSPNDAVLVAGPVPDDPTDGIVPSEGLAPDLVAVPVGSPLAASAVAPVPGVEGVVLAPSPSGDGGVASDSVVPVSSPIVSPVSAADQGAFAAAMASFALPALAAVLATAALA